MGRMQTRSIQAKINENVVNHITLLPENDHEYRYSTPNLHIIREHETFIILIMVKLKEKGILILNYMACMILMLY